MVTGVGTRTTCIVFAVRQGEADGYRNVMWFADTITELLQSTACSVIQQHRNRVTESAACVGTHKQSCLNTRRRFCWGII